MLCVPAPYLVRVADPGRVALDSSGHHVFERDMEPDHDIPAAAQLGSEQESPVHDQDGVVGHGNHMARAGVSFKESQ